ncbi:hypothetical protein QYM36_013107, partial [Artemia franciscana]
MENPVNRVAAGLIGLVTTIDWVFFVVTSLRKVNKIAYIFNSIKEVDNALEELNPFISQFKQHLPKSPCMITFIFAVLFNLLFSFGTMYLSDPFIADPTIYRYRWLYIASRVYWLFAAHARLILLLVPLFEISNKLKLIAQSFKTISPKSKAGERLNLLQLLHSRLLNLLSHVDDAFDPDLIISLFASSLTAAGLFYYAVVSLNELMTSDTFILLAFCFSMVPIFAVITLRILLCALFGNTVSVEVSLPLLNIISRAFLWYLFAGQMENPVNKVTMGLIGFVTTVDWVFFVVNSLRKVNKIAYILNSIKEVDNILEELNPYISQLKQQLPKSPCMITFIFVVLFNLLFSFGTMYLYDPFIADPTIYRYRWLYIASRVYWLFAAHARLILLLVPLFEISNKLKLIAQSFKTISPKSKAGEGLNLLQLLHSRLLNLLSHVDDAFDPDLIISLFASSLTAAGWFYYAVVSLNELMTSDVFTLLAFCFSMVPTFAVTTLRILLCALFGNTVSVESSLQKGQESTAFSAMEKNDRQLVSSEQLVSYKDNVTEASAKKTRGVDAEFDELRDYPNVYKQCLKGSNTAADCAAELPNLAREPLRIIHEMDLTKYDSVVQMQLLMFCNQISTRQLHPTASGFFNLSKQMVCT